MSPKDALAVNEAHADYAGFVFAPSRHQISLTTAYTLKKLLDATILTVGVFVDEPVDVILDLYKTGIIDIAQLHGQSDTDEIAALQAAGLKVIQVFEKQTINLHSKADYLMVDSGKGSGKLLNLNEVPHINRPLILAGGLRPDNVQQVIRIARPTIVDVSSGVETKQKKDPKKIIQFVQNAKKEIDNENLIR